MSKMLTDIRLRSQQLVRPEFKDPKDLVSWMGAVQAQEYRMVKWALGIRLKSATLQTINDAYQRGDILRTHVMRPTWHLVAAEDIRWMLKLSSQRIIAACNSFAKGNGVDIPERTYTKANDLFEKVLEGNNHLTKQELEDEIVKAGIMPDSPKLGYLSHGQNRKVLYAAEQIEKKRRLMLYWKNVLLRLKNYIRRKHWLLLARKYFRSHSPASLSDFVWWSGLPVAEARQAIAAIDGELNKEKFASQELFLHQRGTKSSMTSDVLTF